ncbi:MAG: hypothetical protein HRT68_04010, partial [Flavobacteriaceae bacterium]|nr:hypothetical protein [Flavobacteriaceae bacterium]
MIKKTKSLFLYIIFLSSIFTFSQESNDLKKFGLKGLIKELYIYEKEIDQNILNETSIYIKFNQKGNVDRKGYWFNLTIDSLNRMKKTDIEIEQKKSSDIKSFYSHHKFIGQLKKRELYEFNEDNQT